VSSSRKTRWSLARVAARKIRAACPANEQRVPGEKLVTDPNADSVWRVARGINENEAKRSDVELITFRDVNVHMGRRRPLMHHDLRPS